MHRESQFSNTGQCSITIIVTNRGGQSNRKKGHSRLFNLIRISLQQTSVIPCKKFLMDDPSGTGLVVSLNKVPWNTLNLQCHTFEIRLMGT